MPPACLLALVLAAAPEPATAPLWGDTVPGPNSAEKDNIPTLTAYLPAADKATGAAVVVCPGGGYSGRATGHEGKEIAEWLTAPGHPLSALRATPHHLEMMMKLLSVLLLLLLQHRPMQD